MVVADTDDDDDNVEGDDDNVIVQARTLKMNG
jgi:hypothetical protein